MGRVVMGWGGVHVRLAGLAELVFGPEQDVESGPWVAFGHRRHRREPRLEAFVEKCLRIVEPIFIQMQAADRMYVLAEFYTYGASDILLNHCECKDIVR